MTTKIYNANGKVIHASRNLRGLFDHARRVVPVRLQLTRDPTDKAYPGSYTAVIWFHDDSYGIAEFADWHVAVELFGKRLRSWPIMDVKGTPSGIAVQYFRYALRAKDRRYSVRQEYTGNAAPQWVARFCGEWINNASDAPTAWKLAAAYHMVRLP